MVIELGEKRKALDYINQALPILRAINDRRSESNPSGLLVAEFSEQQMVGERDADLLQQSQLLEK